MNTLLPFSDIVVLAAALRGRSGDPAWRPGERRV
jgi:hypothetical protein